MGVSGKVTEEPKWHPYSPQNGELLDVAFTYSDLIWPWSGFLAVHITVTKEGANFEGNTENTEATSVFLRPLCSLRGT